MANNLSWDLSYDRHKCLLVTLVRGLRGSPPYRGGVVCGSSTPGRATHAEQAEGKRQVKFGPLVLQVGGWAEGKTLLLHKPEALCATRHEEDGWGECLYTAPLWLVALKCQ